MPGNPIESKGATLGAADASFGGGRFGLLSFSCAKTQSVVSQLSSQIPTPKPPSPSGASGKGEFRVRSGRATRAAALRCVISSEEDFLLVRDLLLERLGLRMPPGNSADDGEATLLERVGGEARALAGLVAETSPRASTFYANEEKPPLSSDDEAARRTAQSARVSSFTREIEAEELQTPERFVRRSLTPHSLSRRWAEGGESLFLPTVDDVGEAHTRKRPWR